MGSGPSAGGRAATVERLEVGGVGLSLGRAGRGETAVLFVHGLGASRACFSEAPRFFDPDRHLLLLPDLPGFGESDEPEGGDCSMEGLARALEELLVRLGVLRVHLVGHSMGGAVALLLAGSPRIEALSFVSAEGNLAPEDAFMSGKVARLREPVFERVFTKWLRMVEESLGPGPVDQHRVFLDSLRATRPRVLHRASVSCLALTGSGELGRRFGALGCPRLYVVGERSLEARGLPAPVRQAGVEVVAIPTVGHFVMERAEAFYPAVRQHLEAAERGRAPSRRRAD